MFPVSTCSSVVVHQQFSKEFLFHLSNPIKSILLIILSHHRLVTEGLAGVHTHTHTHLEHSSSWQFKTAVLEQSAKCMKRHVTMAAALLLHALSLAK